MNPLENAFYVISYPRSGNTWLINSLSLLFNGIKAEAYSTFPDYKYHYRWNNFFFRSEKSINSHNPVIIKSHAAYETYTNSYPPKKCIYISRDGRDVMLSYYFYTKAFILDDGYTTSICGKHKIKNVHSRTINKFDQTEFTAFIKDNLTSWEEHLQSWKNREGICYVTYQSLHKDYEVQLEKICNYLEYPTKISVRDVKKAFSNEDKRIFRSNNGDFYRKGIVGDWKNYFSRTHIKYFSSISDLNSV